MEKIEEIKKQALKWAGGDPIDAYMAGFYDAMTDALNYLLFMKEEYLARGYSYCDKGYENDYLRLKTAANGISQCVNYIRHTRIAVGDDLGYFPYVSVNPE